MLGNIISEDFFDNLFSYRSESFCEIDYFIIYPLTFLICPFYIGVLFSRIYKSKTRCAFLLLISKDYSCYFEIYCCDLRSLSVLLLFSNFNWGFPPRILVLVRWKECKFSVETFLVFFYSYDLFLKTMVP